MIDFFRALGCLLLACVAGEAVLCFGVDIKAGEYDHTNPFVLVYIYGWLAVFAAPFWLIAFLPLYFGLSAKSFVWQWYVTASIGMLIGFIGSLIVFGTQDFYYPRDLFYPAAIGFTVFLLGAFSKRRRA